MNGFVCFGEIMLRLSPLQRADKLLSTPAFLAGYAGAESNVAVSLAILENQVSFVSKVPDNPIGVAALQSLKQFGIDTQNVLKGGKRLGTYFIESGASIRPSRVVYDREGSAISGISKGEFDWEAILKDKKWLHLSGIMPALSHQCAEETVLAAKMAKAMGVKVSFDLNFRRSLWADHKMAQRIFDQVIPHSDVIFANLGSLKDVYDYTFSGATTLEQTRMAMLEANTFFGVNDLVFTIREHYSASRNKLQGLALHQGEIVTSRSYDIQIEDRFGTGDAFAAAYLHALDKDWDAHRGIEFATAAFALKHTVHGDLHTSSEQEIVSVMEGQTTGHVIR